MEEPEQTLSSAASAELRVPNGSRNTKAQEKKRKDFTDDQSQGQEDRVSESAVKRSAAHIYESSTEHVLKKRIKPDPDNFILPFHSEETEMNVIDIESYSSGFKMNDVHAIKVLDLSRINIADYIYPSPLSFLPPSLTFPISQINSLENEYNEMEVRLSHIRRMHNLSGTSEVHPPPAHGSNLKIPILSGIVRKLVKQRFNEIKKSCKAARENDVLLGRSEDTLDHLNQNVFEQCHPNLPAFSSLYSANGDADESASLPFCRPFLEDYQKGRNDMKHLFGKVNESSRIGSTLKDIIVKNISEKIKFRDSSSDENYLPQSRDSDKCDDDLASHSHVFKLKASQQRSQENIRSETGSVGKRSKKENKGMPGLSKMNDGSTVVKKTRPKRGQYRKYNSQLLMEAVSAVQRGEMSVHRAGSYYGVPHSTLEYKVKERHLLRQKKIRDFQNSTNRNAVSSSAMSTDHDSNPSSTESARSTPKKESSSSPQPSKSTPAKNNTPKKSNSSNNNLSPSSSTVDSQSDRPWFDSYISSSAASHLDSGLSSLLTPVLSPDNSASELLRKLQHKVQTKGPFPLTAYELMSGKERGLQIPQPSSATQSPDGLLLYN